MPSPTPVSTGNPAKVSGGIDPNRLARALTEMLVPALDALGKKEVASVRADLSVPVEMDDRGGIIRSKIGEPPRMEFGVLRENVEHDVLRGEGTELPTLRIAASRPPISPSDDPHAAWILEFELDRPFMSTALVRLEAEAKSFIEKFLSKR